MTAMRGLVSGTVSFAQLFRKKLPQYSKMSITYFPAVLKFIITSFLLVELSEAIVFALVTINFNNHSSNHVFMKFICDRNQFCCEPLQALTCSSEKNKLHISAFGISG
jgi:hypothetical protein